MFGHVMEIGELIYRQNLPLYTWTGVVMGWIFLMWYLSAAYIIYVLCRRQTVVDMLFAPLLSGDEVMDDLSGIDSTGIDNSGENDESTGNNVLQRMASLSAQMDDLRAQMEETAKKSIIPLVPEFLIIGYQTITVALATEPMVMTLPIIIQSGITTWFAASLPAMAMPTMNVMTGMMMPSQCPSVVTISLREFMRLPNLKYVEGIDIRQNQLYIFSAHFQMPILLTFYDGTLANWVEYCSSRQIIMQFPGGGNSVAAKQGGPYTNTRQRNPSGLIRKKKYM